MAKKILKRNGKRVAVVRANPRSKQLFFLYQGNAGAMFLEPAQFISYAKLWDKNLIMFRDPYRSCYHGQGVDIRAEIEWQRQLRDGCPQVSKFFCTGTSSGAYAAILFGHYLSADHVVAFAPMTKLNIESMLDDPLMPDKKIDRSDIPDEHMDLACLLQDWNGKTKFIVIFSEGHASDRQHAERIAHFPFVKLLPVPGKSHNPFASINAKRLIEKIFRPAR